MVRSALPVFVLVACTPDAPKQETGGAPPPEVVWEPLSSTGLPAYVGSTWPVSSMVTVADTLLIALGELGLYRSTDAGASFTAVDLPLDQCLPLGLDVTEAGRVLVTCFTETGNDGIWASDDGSSFAPSATGLSPSNEYYPQLVELGGRLFYDAARVSDDGGTTWSTTDGAPTGCIPYLHGETLYCQRNAVADAHTWTSEDLGVTWTDVTDPGTSPLTLTSFVEAGDAVWALDTRANNPGDPDSALTSSVVQSLDGVVWALYEDLPARSPVAWTLLGQVDEVLLASVGPSSADGEAANGPVFYFADGVWRPATRGDTAEELAGAYAVTRLGEHVILLTESGFVRGEYASF